jgi:large subunit ribosomal protein L3
MAGTPKRVERAIVSAIYFYLMKFILARKGRMTQIFDESGRVYAGTIVQAGPVVVTQVKEATGKDGYAAVQVAFGEQKESRVAKPQLGHTKGKAYRFLKEFKTEAGDLTVGTEIKADTFAEGDTVVIASTSKGHGFAGVVKRHGFHGGRRSHGQKHSEREAGSIGGGGRAGGRVAKGMRMAGRMGGDRVTIKNLKVLKVNAATGEMIISGAIPGAPGALVEIMSA